MERSNLEHKAFMWLSTNSPGSEEHYTYTEVTPTECILEWPEAQRVILQFSEDLEFAEVIDYPYVT